MNRIHSMLSLCMKAGKLATGETAVEKALRKGEALLVMVASDASDNTRKKFINKCFYYKKPAMVYGDKDSLSHCVGKHNRAVFAVTETHFAQKLQSLIHLEVDECQNP